MTIIFFAVIINTQYMNTIRQSNLPKIQDPSSEQTSFINTLSLNTQQTSKSMTDKNFITINNHVFLQRRAKYSKDIKGDLDPRDREIIFPFQIQFNISNFKRNILAESNIKEQSINEASKNNTNKKQKSIELLTSQQYIKMRNQIYDYVSEVCQYVNSITFQLLNAGKLTEDQAKALASKNILANIQSVFTQIKKKFSEHGLESESNQLLQDLTQSIDEQLNIILSELASHYPQAPTAGETLRMREVIINIERSQDQHTDLIFANKMQISKYIKRNSQGLCDLAGQNPQDYTGFIMEVINKAINITRDPFSNESNQSIFLKFKQFSQNLFCIGQYYTIKDNQKQQEKKIIQTFKQILKRNQNNQNKESINEYEKNKNIQCSPSKNKSPVQSLKFIVNKSEDTIIENKQKYHKEMQSMKIHHKNEHKCGIAQKIPNYVKPFSDIAIKNAKFEVHHSSVLRIMTKWAQYLQEIFQKPQVHIQQRLYDFKNLSNQLKYLQKNSKQQMCKNLREQYVQVKNKLKELQEKNTLFQSHILSLAEAGTTYLKRFTYIRSASSQINTLLIQFTRKYLCILMHHLIKAGNIKQGMINLVMFRVGDLLRSKLQCSERSFINILKILNILDQSKEKIKLVRIKNKLNDKDNNILINYMFMGKVQCELQLSIHSMAPKDKNYYAFTHFLYQLTRGKFGVLTQCAIIVSQDDPIVNSSKDMYYRPKHYQKTPQGEKQSHIIYKKDESIYKCWKCHQLILGDNVELFVKSQTSCNQCIAKGQNPQLKLNHEKIKKLMLQLQSMSKISEDVTRISNYGEIKNRKIKNNEETQPNYVLSISNHKVNSANKAVRLHRVWKHQRELKLFMIEINQDVLGGFKKQKYDLNGIDYFDISSQKEKKEQLKEITYLINKNSISSIVQFMQIQSFKQKQNDFQKEFIRFRIQKSIIKSIKTKSEIIDLRDDDQKLQELNYILEAVGTNQKQRLLYKKCNVLDYKHIKAIKLKQMRLQEQRSLFFMKYINQVNQISLRNNSTKSISFQQQTSLEKIEINSSNLCQINNLEQCESLTQLKIYNNLLTNIDLTKNKNLTQLILQDNKLGTIDLKENIKLTSLNLFQNNLQFIQLPSNKPYKDQHQSTSKQTKLSLTNLNLSQNLLQSIDLSQHPNIKKLKLRNNQLKSIIFWYCQELLDDGQFDIGNQKSQNCQITILYHKGDQQKCNQLGKHIIQRYNNQQIEKQAISQLYSSQNSNQGDIKQSQRPCQYSYIIKERK